MESSGYEGCSEGDLDAFLFRQAAACDGDAEVSAKDVLAGSKGLEACLVERVGERRGLHMVVNSANGLI